MPVEAFHGWAVPGGRTGGRPPMISARVFMLVGAALGLIAIERLVNAALLGFAADGSRSLRLGIAFVCGALAPLVFGVGCFKASRALGKADAALDAREPPSRR